MPNGCEISNCMYESGGGGGSDELIEAARGRHKISGQNVSIHKCKQASMWPDVSLQYSSSHV